MAEEQQTVWITKYALNSGISEEQGEIARASPSMVVVRRKQGLDGYFHGEGREWHRTKEAALARAEEMRKAKIVNHEKAIAKLKKLTFA